MRSPWAVYLHIKTGFVRALRSPGLFTGSGRLLRYSGDCRSEGVCFTGAGWIAVPRSSFTEIWEGSLVLFYWFLQVTRPLTGFPFCCFIGFCRLYTAPNGTDGRYGGNTAHNPITTLTAVFFQLRCRSTSRLCRRRFLYRLCMQPSVWRRYLLGNPLFLLRILRQKFFQA